jgi:NADH-quinone oxidoreductase subunit A
VLWPLAFYFVVVVGLAAAMLAASAVLGEHHRENATTLPYESGIAATGSAHVRFGASFYLIAVFFVIFDLEAVYLFAWAVALRDVGWPGYLGGVVFVGVLFVALVYLWRSGGIDASARGTEELRR